MRNLKSLAAGVIALAVVSSMATVAVAGSVGSETGSNLVTNGDFETGDFSGWTPSGTFDFSSVVCDGGGNGGSPCYANVGPVGALSFISQDIPTVAGVDYNIHVFLQSDGETPNEFRISWGGVVVFDTVNEPAHGYIEIIVDPPATGAIMELELGFRNDLGFFQFDDVSVFATTEAVPAPAALSMLALGLTTFGLVRARRGSASAR